MVVTITNNKHRGEVVEEEDILTVTMGIIILLQVEMDTTHPNNINLPMDTATTKVINNTLTTPNNPVVVVVVTTHHTPSTRASIIPEEVEEEGVDTPLPNNNNNNNNITNNIRATTNIKGPLLPTQPSQRLPHAHHTPSITPTRQLQVHPQYPRNNNNNIISMFATTVKMAEKVTV